jgi:malate dehydrogenase
VAVLGASGGIGQPLSLLLKAVPGISHLSLFDIRMTPGVAADLSHVPTTATVSGHEGEGALEEALTGADVVIIPAGMPRKPGMTRDDLFAANAGIVKTLITGVAEFCPKAMVGIITNPVNATVPIASEVMKAAGVYDPKRLFGITTLDICRTRTFVAQHMGVDVAELPPVTVVGGHAGTTILPLLSQIEGAKFTEEELAAMTHRIQFGGDEVVQAKAGAGSATLSMAYAGAVFTKSLIRAMSGEEGVVECTFVESDVTDAPFFSTPIELGPEGVKKINGTGALTPFEQEGLDALVPELAKSAAKGRAFILEA